MNNSFWDGFLKQASILDKGVKSLSKRVRRGYRSEMMRSGGPDSLVAWPFIEASKKIVGPKKTYKALNKFHEKALSADMIAGHLPHKIMQKMPIGKNLFIQRDTVPYGKGMLKEVDRTSLMAPLVKARDVAAPIALGVALDKVVKKNRTGNEQGTS